MIKTLPMNHMDMERKRRKYGPKTPQIYIVHPILMPVYGEHNLAYHEYLGVYG